MFHRIQNTPLMPEFKLKVWKLCVQKCIYKESEKARTWGAITYCPPQPNPMTDKVNNNGTQQSTVGESLIWIFSGSWRIIYSMLDVLGALRIMNF